MRSEPIQNKHRAFQQRVTLDSGETETLVVQANSRTILTDEVPVGELRYDRKANTFLSGATEEALSAVLRAQGALIFEALRAQRVPAEHYESMKVRVEGVAEIEPAPGEYAQPFIVIDRSIPPDEVHFRQGSKTVAVMKLGDGQVLAMARRMDQVPVVGSLLAAVKLDRELPREALP